MRAGLNNKERNLVLSGRFEEFFNLGVAVTRPSKDNDCTIHNKAKLLAYRKRYNGKSRE